MNKKLVYLALIVLTVIHQDFWWWDDPTLVLGFLPIGLAYHAAYSVAAAALWWTALRVAWPSEVEAFADAQDTDTR